jgi:hypothetical protein
MILPIRLVALFVLISFTTISDVAAADTDTTYYTVFMESREAGVQKAWVAEEGKRVYFYTYNDRGRGPAITEEISLAWGGEYLQMSISGHDYTKNQVNEQFTAFEGIARWKSASDEGSTSYIRQYYYPVNGTNGGKEVLIQFLEWAGGSELNLLPFGKITLSVKEAFEIEGHALTLYGLSGVSYAPSFYWMDEDMKLFAVVSPSRGITCIRKGYGDLKDVLVKHQMDLIRSTELQIKIIELYEQHYKRYNDIDLNLEQLVVFGIVTIYFSKIEDAFIINNGRYRIDFETLKRDYDVLDNECRKIHNMTRIAHSSMIECKNEIISLLSLLRKEIT